ncbi:MAG: hypothetical protein Q4D96_08355, partial [Propionibacteriaceae bacterium]|nr:hypothetical protein [Propionibacteriaceae bacterium]
LHTHDPQGLRPVTDNELQKYNQQHSGNFFERHGTAIAGVVLFVAGAVLTATVPGLGVIAGGVLMGAGGSMLSQGLQNPGEPPDMFQVGINAAFGAIGGGITAGLVAKGGQAVATAATKWWGQAIIGAGTGAASGATEGVYTAARYGITGDDYTEHIANSTLTGAIFGAASSVVPAGMEKGLRWWKGGGGSGGVAGSSVPESPAPGSADILPRGPAPEVPSQVVPRRALPEEAFMPRRSSGEEAFESAVPRRAMPQPEPRRALQEQDFGEKS